MNQRQSDLLKVISSASQDLGSDEMVYSCGLLFTDFCEALLINGLMLHTTYPISMFSLRDLDVLEKCGFLTRIQESEGDPITFEKEIRYKINEVFDNASSAPAGTESSAK